MLNDEFIAISRLQYSSFFVLRRESEAAAEVWNPQTHDRGNARVQAQCRAKILGAEPLHNHYHLVLPSSNTNQEVCLKYKL